MNFEEFSQESPREEVNAWVARFAPILMQPPGGSEAELRTRLAVIEELQAQAPELSIRSAQLDTIADADLLRTFKLSREQLDEFELDIRRRLSRSSPGSPESRPRLDELQERLAETGANIEMGFAPTHPTGPLEVMMSEADPAAATGLGLFGAGVLAFSIFHCIVMIGGMMMAFGPLALFLLLFYSIFFFAGGSMIHAAYQAASQVSISLDGARLELRRKFMGASTENQHRLDPRAGATLGKMQSAQPRGKNSAPKFIPCVHLTLESGKELNVPISGSVKRQREILDAINQQLASAV